MISRVESGHFIAKWIGKSDWDKLLNDHPNAKIEIFYEVETPFGNGIIKIYNSKSLVKTTSQKEEDNSQDLNFEPPAELKVLIECKNINNKIRVTFVAIEDKDPNGGTSLYDCFNIEGLTEDEYKKILHQVSHLVNRVVQYRKEGLPIPPILII